MKTINLYIQPKMGEKCQAHNLKVVGSNPTPATNYINKINDLDRPQRLLFLGIFVVILFFIPTVMPTGRQVFCF